MVSVLWLKYVQIKLYIDQKQRIIKIFFLIFETLQFEFEPGLVNHFLLNHLIWNKKMNIFQKASLMQKYQQDGVIVSEKM